MTNATTFGTQYFNAVQSLINDLENLRVLNDRMAQDNTLISGYFSASGARSDIAAQDFTNASGAVTQLLFSFDSGSPTQKSYLFKLL